MDAHALLDKCTDHAMITTSALTAPSTVLVRVMPHEVATCVIMFVMLGTRHTIERVWHWHRARCTRCNPQPS